MDPERKNPAANRARLILVGLAAVAQKSKRKSKSSPAVCTGRRPPSGRPPVTS